MQGLGLSHHPHPLLLDNPGGWRLFSQQQHNTCDGSKMSLEILRVRDQSGLAKKGLTNNGINDTNTVSSNDLTTGLHNSQNLTARMKYLGS